MGLSFWHVGCGSLVGKAIGGRPRPHGIPAKPGVGGTTKATGCLLQVPALEIILGGVAPASACIPGTPGCSPLPCVLGRPSPPPSQAVPEPRTLLLPESGRVGLAGAVWRRHRRT